MQNQGILYIASGEKHYQEAIRSVQSLKTHLPEIKTAIITDRQNVLSLFDIVLPMQASAKPFRDKILYLAQSPFNETLFLDSDTYICGDFRACFKLLERFDIAAAVDIKRMALSSPSLPDCFPELNTGVILYKQSAAMENLFQEWLRLYDEGIFTQTWLYTDDQAAFRQALYESKLHFATLPHSYHARYLSAGLLAGKAYILHGRPNDQYQTIEKVAVALNKSELLRVYVAGQIFAYQYGGRFFAGQKARWLTSFSHPLWFASLQHLYSSIKKRGFRKTLDFIYKRFSRY